MDVIVIATRDPVQWSAEGLVARWSTGRIQMHISLTALLPLGQVSRSGHQLDGVNIGRSSH